MVLNKNNIEEEIRRVSLHDDIIEEFKFDREKGILSLTLLAECDNWRQYTIDYKGVFMFEMSSCNCWGEYSPHIFDFEYMDGRYNLLLPRLLDDIFNRSNIDDRKKNLESAEDLFETWITFTSGDRLRVVCKSIEIEKGITN